jgi:hypothetical protein
MKPSPQQIEQARKKLELYDSGKGVISHSEAEHLRYLVTGKKVEISPREPFWSNRSFFHLKNIACILSLQLNSSRPDCTALQMQKGVFNHDDYASFYSFTPENGEPMFFEGGQKFSGILTYENYEPISLALHVGELPSSKEVIVANKSLTAACL